MTTAPTGEDPMNLRDRESDDLTAIKGIGPTRQQWLRESLGVRTYRDLTALSVDEIESRLKAEGRPVPRSEIEEWIVQAQEYIDINLPPPPVPEPEVEAGMEGNSSEVEDAWKLLASFVVEFQVRQVAGRASEERTTVHYMEADKSEEWPGIEGEQLRQWMLDQVSEKLPRDLEEEVPVGEPSAVPLADEAQPTAPRPLTVAVAQLRAFQPPKTQVPSAVGETGRPFQGFVRGDVAFALEASFELAGPAAVEAASEQRTYSLQFYAHNRATGESIDLGATPPEVIGEAQPSYSAALSKVSLPPGMYRLHAVVVVEGTPPVMGYLEVPLLQVV